MNKSLQEEYKTSRPLDVACYFGNAWEMNNIVSEEICEELLRNREWVTSLDDDGYEQWRQRDCWKWAAITLETRRRVKELAQKHFPEEEVSFVPDSDAVYGLMLAFVGDESVNGAKGIESGKKLAQRFELEFQEAESLWSALSVRRLDEESVLALIGDDRGLDGGTYFVAVAYAPSCFVEAWSQDAENPWFPTL